MGLSCTDGDMIYCTCAKLSSSCTCGNSIIPFEIFCNVPFQIFCNALKC